MSEQRERFEDGRGKAVRALLEAANIMAEMTNIAPDDEPDRFINFLGDTVNLLRDIADRIKPPVEDWPDKVVPISKGKRKGRA